MNRNTIPSLTPLLISVALLSACGGGGDEAGAPAPLSITPTTITLTAPTGTPAGICFAGPSGAQVYVYGGTAPYRIDNTLPDDMTLDKTVVDSPGGSFTFALTGGCFSPGQIVVVDSLNRQVILTVNNKPAS